MRLFSDDEGDGKYPLLVRSFDLVFFHLLAVINLEDQTVLLVCLQDHTNQQGNEKGIKKKFYLKFSSIVEAGGIFKYTNNKIKFN